MKKQFITSAILAIAAAGNSFAGPADYVYTPTVTYGEKEIDFKFGTQKTPDGQSKSASSIGFGYGATQYWFTEIYVKYNRESGSGTRLDAFEWENKFQLTPTGKYPVDVGFLLEIERPQNRNEGYEFKFGPLFQTDFGKFQLNANLLFERHIRATEPGQTEMGYQLQAKYRWKQELEFGIQAFGEVGKWDHWAPRSEQSHRYGPAIFGKIPLGKGQALNYNAAFLFDTNRETRSNTFRTQIEYEFF